MFLSDISIKRPVFATMMMVTLVVLGVVSIRRLAIDEYPDITYPVVSVSTTLPGGSPESMMRDVSRPLEEALNTVQGIKEINSTSSEGNSNVRITFNLNVDIGTAQQDVAAKVQRIRRGLPPNVEEPVIQHFDPNESPIMAIGVQSSERQLRDLTDLADETIQPRIEAIAGVGGVNMNGGRRRQIRVQLDPDAMRAYGISPLAVTQALQRENQDVPAGRVERGLTQQLVRITGRVVDPKAFADIVVTVRNNSPVRLGDIASVIDGVEDRRSTAEVDGIPAVVLEVLKISGANTVEVSDSVQSALISLQRQLPNDVKLTLIRDDSKRIRESLTDVETSLALGALLTIMIIYLFLNSWRSTVITGLTLPVSIISAFFIMWICGFTVNTMTLLALSLAIGLLIDDAIVVRENIVRHVEMGKDHYRAAKEGTDEIGLAVISTTLAVVAVFVPVAFMGGMIGRIFFQFGVTVAFAVLVSLFVSFTLDPMLSSIWYDPEIEEAHDTERPRNLIKRGVLKFNQAFERVADRYPGWLSTALTRRWTILGAAGVTVIIAFFLIPTIGFSWMPDVDGNEFNVGYRVPPGSRLEYTQDKGREIAQFLRHVPDVEHVHLQVGGGFQGTPNNGRLTVILRDKDSRARTMSDIQGDLRVKLKTIPGVRPSITGQKTVFGGGYRQPIIVNVQGPEPTRLRLAAQRVLAAVRSVPGVAEPNSSEEGSIPQLNVAVDRQEAWRAGLGIQSIASTLQPLFSGQRATRWEDPLGFSHDVLVVYPDSMRVSAADVAGIPVASSTLNPRSGTAAMIPLSQVASIQAGVGPQQIDRRSLEQQFSISAGVLPGYAVGAVADRVMTTIDSMGLPPGYHAVFTGDVQNLNETKGYVLEAIFLAVIFIYLILASLFGSFLQPLSIMLALPLSFIGVTMALLLTRGNLNVMTMIGIIMLMGLVTKNGILLVDFTNQQRAAGMNRREALLSAGRIRLRPIIMTTVAMIFGMLPLALAVGAGAEARAPMARAVIGGLVTSTLLTLFVVPVVYTLLDDAAAWVAGRGARRAASAHAARPMPETATAGD